MQATCTYDVDLRSMVCNYVAHVQSLAVKIVSLLGLEVILYLI